jgi:hypothetical protein
MLHPEVIFLILLAGIFGVCGLVAAAYAAFRCRALPDAPEMSETTDLVGRW